MAENSSFSFSKPLWLMTYSSSEWSQQASLLGDQSGLKSNWLCAERKDLCNLVLSGIEFWFGMNVISSLKTGQVIFCWAEYNFAQETQTKSGAFVSAFIKVIFLERTSLMLHFQQLNVKEIPFLNKRWEKNVMRRLRYTDGGFHTWQFYHTPMCQGRYKKKSF